MLRVKFEWKMPVSLKQAKRKSLLKNEVKPDQDVKQWIKTVSPVLLTRLLSQKRGKCLLLYLRSCHWPFIMRQASTYLLALKTVACDKTWINLIEITPIVRNRPSPSLASCAGAPVTWRMSVQTRNAWNAGIHRSSTLTEAVYSVRGCQMPTALIAGEEVSWFSFFSRLAGNTVKGLVCLIFGNVLEFEAKQTSARV